MVTTLITLWLGGAIGFLVACILAAGSDKTDEWDREYFKYLQDKRRSSIDGWPR